MQKETRATSQLSNLLNCIYSWSTKTWHPSGRSKWRKHLRYTEIENQGADKYSPFVLKYCIYSLLVCNQHTLYTKCKQKWTIITWHVAQAHCNTGFSTEDAQKPWQKIRQSCTTMAKQVHFHKYHTQLPCFNSRHSKSPWSLTHIQSHSAKIHTLCSQCRLFSLSFIIKNDTEHKHTYTI